MIKMLCGIAFLLLFPSSLISQPTLKLYGTIRDTLNDVSISDASVFLVNTVSEDTISGAVSRQDGRFILPYKTEKNTAVHIEHIAYADKIIKIADQNIVNQNENGFNLGQIYLTKQVLDLSPIQVSGILKPYQHDGNKIIYNVSSNSILNSKTGVEALRAIPSVDVDLDGLITLRGDANVRILVNGVPSGLASGDKRSNVDIIAADIIEYIEVLSNPSVQYDADGMGGIINIVTTGNNVQRNKTKFRISTDSFGGYNGLLAKNYKKNNLSLFFSSSLRHDIQKLNTSRNYNWNYPLVDIVSKQERSELKDPTVTSFNLNTNYNPSVSHSVNIGSNLAFYNGGVYDTIRHLYPVEYRMTSDDSKTGWALDFQTSYKWQSLSGGKTLETVFSFSRSGDYEKGVNDRNINGIGADDHSHIFKDDWFRNRSLKSIYHWPIFSKADLFTGLHFQIKEMRRELDYLHLPYSFNHDEKISAIFFNSEYRLTSKLKLDVGFRAESFESKGDLNEIELVETHHHKDTSNVFTEIIETSISTSPFEQSNIEFYPSAKMLYIASKELSLRLVYSKRTNRPSRPSLNPFPVSMIDEYHVRVGNPELAPELIDLFETKLNYEKSKLQFYGTFYFKKIDKLILWNSFNLLPIDQLQYEVISTMNYGGADAFGIEFYLYYTLNNNYSFNIDYTSWTMDVISSGLLENNGSRKGSSGQFTVSAAISNNIKLDVMATFRGKLQIPNGSVDPSYYLDMSIHKKIPKSNLSLTLSLRDLFDSKAYNFSTNELMRNLTSGQSYSQDLVTKKRNNYRSILLTASYDIGKMRKIKKKYNGKKKEDVNIDYNY